MNRPTLADQRGYNVLQTTFQVVVTRIHYARYDPGDAFDDWHVDEYAKGIVRYRQLAMIITLSRPADYEGGSFQAALRGGEIWTNRPEANSALCFPADSLSHRATEVTSGTRRVLVAWACSRDATHDLEPCVTVPRATPAPGDRVPTPDVPRPAQAPPATSSSASTRDRLRAPSRPLLFPSPSRAEPDPRSPS